MAASPSSRPVAPRRRLWLILPAILGLGLLSACSGTSGHATQPIAPAALASTPTATPAPRPTTPTPTPTPTPPKPAPSAPPATTAAPAPPAPPAANETTGDGGAMDEPVGFAEPPAAPAPEPEPEPVGSGGGGGTYFANCTAAKEAGAAPLYVGDPGYRPELDRDRDGVACET